MLTEVGGPELIVTGMHRAAVHKQKVRTAVFDDLIHVLNLFPWLSDAELDLTDVQRQVDAEDRFLLAVSGARPPGEAGPLGRFAMSRTAGADTEAITLHRHGRSAQLMGLEHGYLRDQTGTRTMGSDPWEPVATRRSFTRLLDAVLAGLHNPTGCKRRRHPGAGHSPTR